MPDEPRPYPANLLIAGSRCLVVGGGPVGAGKAEGLVDCGAAVTVVATAVGARIREMAATGPADDGAGSVVWEERAYRAGEVAGYRLAVAATDRAEVNEAIRADGDVAGVWVNRVDDAAGCSFTVPSVLRRGPLVVTVATGGRSPALARWLLGRLSDQIGPEYEALLDLLAVERRARREAGRPVDPASWQRALDSDMLDLIRSGQVGKARERLQACLSSS